MSARAIARRVRSVVESSAPAGAGRLRKMNGGRRSLCGWTRRDMGSAGGPRLEFQIGETRLGGAMFAVNAAHATGTRRACAASPRRRNARGVWRLGGKKPPLFAAASCRTPKGARRRPALSPRVARQGLDSVRAFRIHECPRGQSDRQREAHFMALDGNDETQRRLIRKNNRQSS